MKRSHLYHVIIASGFGSGFWPYGPGTAGALLATLIWLGVSFCVSSVLLILLTLLAILIFTFLGVKSADALEGQWGKDPSRVVIDEMVGVWIALLAANGQNFMHAFVAFLLFRFFDILKPLGIRKMESIKGGWGVMMDDILAGIYSFIVLIFMTKIFHII
ncbi:MAG: phosphatidylglycerophosphatase A [Dysgonamonadaceae bacterium]